MTFSILGRCGETGMLGVAITSSSIAVGSRCAWAYPGVAVVATQNLTQPGLADIIYRHRIELGRSLSETIRTTVMHEKHSEYRQIAALDVDGEVSHYTGFRVFDIAATSVGTNCIAVGNMLKHESVAHEMIKSFENSTTDQHLAERLLDALDAGLYNGGGEQRDLRSAVVLVTSEASWPIVNLRVDWDEAPLTKLRDHWTLYEPQVDDFIARAYRPNEAPDF